MRVVLRTFEPCLPTKATKAPSGEQWVHEVKHDGYRLIARRVDDRVSLYTKGGYNWAARYPRIVAALSLLKVKSVVIDGEVTWINGDGASDFNALHSRAYDNWAPLCAFDLLELNGEDYRSRPLLERKRTLKKLLGKGKGGLQYVDHLEGDGQAIFEHICRMGLEGIVSKRIDAPYRPGPSKSWIKVKNRKHPALMRVAEANGW
jgi:bifunctional non-homologous end joining protein LigD